MTKIHQKAKFKTGRIQIVQNLRPVRVGLEIASALTRLYPTQYQPELAARLFGSRDTITRIKTGEDPAVIAASWAAAEARWRLMRAKYLLYGD